MLLSLRYLGDLIITTGEIVYISAKIWVSLFLDKTKSITPMDAMTILIKLILRSESVICWLFQKCNTNLFSMFKYLPQNGTRRTSTIIFFRVDLLKIRNIIILNICSFTSKYNWKEMSQRLVISGVTIVIELIFQNQLFLFWYTRYG